MSIPSQSTKILLLGAGELGTALLPHLLTLPIFPYTLTLGVRNPQTYTHLSSLYPTLSLTAIDLTYPSASLIPQFSTYDIILSATGFAASPSSVIKLANEILNAGRLRQSRGQGRLWYFPWQWGVDYDITLDGRGLMPLFGAQKSVRDILRSKADDAGVEWSVVSTGIFMSFLFEGFWGVVDRSHDEEEKPETGHGDGESTVRCLGSWEHEVTVTHVDDIGRVVARILAGDVEARNRISYVAGDTVSYGQLANIVEMASGRTVKREEWSQEYLEEELAKDPEDSIKRYRLVFSREGVWWDKKRTVNAKLGMRMVEVEDFAKGLFKKA